MNEPGAESGNAWGATTERQGGELVRVAVSVLEMGGGNTPEPFLRHSTNWYGMQLRSPPETMFLNHRS